MSNIGSNTLDRIIQLDDMENVFYATARHTPEYRKYRKLVNVMRVQLAVCKVQPERKRSLLRRVKRTIARAEHVMHRRVNERDAWYFEGRGLLDDRFDFPLIGDED